MITSTIHEGNNIADTNFGVDTGFHARRSVVSRAVHPRYQRSDLPLSLGSTLLIASHYRIHHRFNTAGAQRGRRAQPIAIANLDSMACQIRHRSRITTP